MVEPARFSLRQVIAETEKEPFAFDGPDGEVLELPHASVLTLRQATRMDTGDLEGVLREVSPKVAEVILDLPGYAIEALIAAWLAHAGTSAGESSASSRSSTSTRRPSTSTSKRTTGSALPRRARRS